MPWSFNATYASVVGLGFMVDTLLRHQWSVDVEWATDYAQADIIRMCGLHDTTGKNDLGNGL